MAKQGIYVRMPVARLMVARVAILPFASAYGLGMISRERIDGIISRLAGWVSKGTRLRIE